MIFRRLLVCFVASVTLAIAAEPRSQVLIDFESDDTAKWEQRSATIQSTRWKDSRAVEITAAADAPYPGIAFQAQTDVWNLSAFDGVSVELHNPTAESVRVLFAINDPQSDGKTHTSVSTVTLSPGDSQTLTVPFGTWHGQTNVVLDTSRIAEFVVFFEKPRSPLRVVVDNITAVTIKSARLEDVAKEPFFQSLRPALGRGVNLGNALEAPNEGEWGVTLKESYFDAIAAAGFDSVRIPVRWSNHALWEAPYTIDEQFAQRVDWAVDNCLERDLEVVLNVHHYYELMEDPDSHEARFLGLWRQIAARYADRSMSLKFELLNEPNDQLTTVRWNPMAQQALAIVRESNPTRDVIIGPGSFNNISELKNLELPEDDRNLIVTFHYYSPHDFTHQGASWSGPEAQDWLGTTWTGTDGEKADVTGALDKAIAWAVENKRPIYMGEFGAYSKADMPSRVAWTQFVTAQALKRRIGFAYWEFCAGFGVYDPKTDQWITPLRDALFSTPSEDR